MMLGAEAAIARGSEDPVGRAALLVLLGRIAQAQGAYGKARLHFGRALELQQSVLPSSDLRLAQTHQWLGASLEGTAHYGLALEHHQAALTLHEQVQGASHPEVARATERGPGWASSALLTAAGAVVASIGGLLTLGGGFLFAARLEASSLGESLAGMVVRGVTPAIIGVALFGWGLNRLNQRDSAARERIGSR